MTDINVVLTSAESGDVLDRFSIHRGGSSTLSSLTSKIRDAIRSELDIDDFIYIAQEEQAQWEIVGEFLSRIAVPGGWLYRYVAINTIVYVPGNR